MKNGGYQVVTLDLAQDLTIITENINISKVLSGQWLFKDYSTGINIINMYYLLYGKYSPDEDIDSLQQKVIQLKNIRYNNLYLNIFTQFYMSDKNPLEVVDTSTTSKKTTINNPLIGYFLLGNQALLIVYNMSRGILVNIFKGGDSNA